MISCLLIFSLYLEKSFVCSFIIKMSCRYSQQVERLIFQERDLCVGRDKCHAALPFRLPLRYQSNMDDLKRLQ